MAGLANHVKRRQIFHYLKEHKIDIACLQETHTTKNCHKRWRAEWGGEIIFSDGTNNAKGVAILINKNSGISVSKSSNIIPGRAMSVEVKSNEVSLTVVNIYAPNEDDADFFIKVFNELQRIESNQTIILGDLNKYLDTKLDKKGGTTPTVTKAAQAVNAFLEENVWVDVWRTFHGTKQSFTYHRRKPLIMSRLDYVLMPVSLYNNVIKCEILPGFLSDHSFVLTDISMSKNIKGPGMWKFNVKHLESKQFVDEINKIIDLSHYRYEELDPGQKWEMLKQDIREFAMQYSIQAAKQRKRNLMNWNVSLKAAYRKLNRIDLNAARVVSTIEKLSTRIDDLKEKIENVSKYKAEGAMIRSKIRYVQQGETSTKYFFGLEKTKAKAKVMNLIHDESDKVIKDPKTILSKQAEFYQKLYSSNSEIKCPEKIKMETILTEEVKTKLDGPITMEELSNAIKQMAQNKTPGTDGLQINVYIMFFVKIKHILFEALQHCIKIGKLTQTM